MSELSFSGSTPQILWLSIQYIRASEPWNSKALGQQSFSKSESEYSVLALRLRLRLVPSRNGAKAAKNLLVSETRLQHLRADHLLRDGAAGQLPVHLGRLRLPELQRQGLRAGHGGQVRREHLRRVQDGLQVVTDSHLIRFCM